jgi:hypothetical protein
MSILTLVVAIAAVGVILYCINQFVPMDGKVKTILNIVVIIVLVVFVLQAFGVFDAFRDVKVPRAHG